VHTRHQRAVQASVRPGLARSSVHFLGRHLVGERLADTAAARIAWAQKGQVVVAGPIGADKADDRPNDVSKYSCLRARRRSTCFEANDFFLQLICELTLRDPGNAERHRGRSLQTVGFP
jgi:hypothetical protein